LSISFFSCSAPLLHPHSFPTRRSSDLLRRAPTAARCRLPAIAAAGFGSGSRAASGQLLRVPPAAARAASRRARRAGEGPARYRRSEEHTSELQSRFDLVCRLLLEKKKT